MLDPEFVYSTGAIVLQWAHIENKIRSDAEAFYLWLDIPFETSDRFASVSSAWRKGALAIVKTDDDLCSRIDDIYQRMLKQHDLRDHLCHAITHLDEHHRGQVTCYVRTQKQQFVKPAAMRLFRLFKPEIRKAMGYKAIEEWTKKDGRITVLYQLEEIHQSARTTLPALSNEIHDLNTLLFRRRPQHGGC